MSTEPQRFDYDVFLSHSAKDKPVVRDVAERLRKDGRMPKAEGPRMKVEVPLHPSSFVLHPFPDWAQLESGTFRFRDPLNKERRFLPLRLEGRAIRGQFNLDRDGNGTCLTMCDHPPLVKEDEFARDFLAELPLNEFCRALFYLNDFAYAERVRCVASTIARDQLESHHPCQH